jgi:hypothetical protein
MPNDPSATAATCDGYEWRGDVPWKCQLPPGHKTADGTFLGRPCRGRSCSHGPDCQLPWPLHDWSYEADYAKR